MSCSDTDSFLYLHAELLPNIRQITLYVSLPQTSALYNVRPTVQLSESCKAVTVSLSEPFQDVSETIKLPARVNGASRRALNTNISPTIMHNPSHFKGTSHDYSFRMQIDAKDPALVPRDEIMDDYVPWTAADMSCSTRIRCRKCGATFLDPAISANIPEEEGTANPAKWAWKDLPSGNWAEMMDFWHCHKPDPHEDDPKSEATAALKLEEQSAQVKGYGAASRVEAIPATVLIDVATFLLAESDCVGLKKVRSPKISYYFQKLKSLHTLKSHFPFHPGNQKETISCPWGGFRYYCPRGMSVHIAFSQMAAISAFESTALEGRYPLSLDGFRQPLLTVLEVVVAAVSVRFLSTFFVANGGLGSLNPSQNSGAAIAFEEAHKTPCLYILPLSICWAYIQSQIAYFLLPKCYFLYFLEPALLTRHFLE